MARYLLTDENTSIRLSMISSITTSSPGYINIRADQATHTVKTDLSVSEVTELVNSAISLGGFELITWKIAAERAENYRR
jgi:hypothetical protein